VGELGRTQPEFGTGAVGEAPSLPFPKGEVILMVIVLPLLVAVIGLLMYALSANPKLVEIGRIMFAFGLLAFLLGAGPVVSALRVSSAQHSQAAPAWTPLSAHFCS
jgi:hypothetical protein